MKTLARCRLAGALMLSWGALAAPAFAQATAPAGSAEAGANDTAISERVKKDAASPLYWIRLNAQKADAPPPKGPRITEVREGRAERPARPAAPAATRPAPAANPTALAAEPGLAAPAPAPAPVAEAAALPGGGGAPAAALVATPVQAAAAGGLAAPTAASAAEATRTALTPPADEPDDQPLTVLQAEEPSFPANVMRKLRKGTVQVRFEVQPDGSVANVSVVESSHRSLNAAALDAVGAWRFQPVRAPRTAVVDLGFDLDA